MFLDFLLRLGGCHGLVLIMVYNTTQVVAYAAEIVARI